MPNLLSVACLASMALMGLSQFQARTDAAARAPAKLLARTLDACFTGLTIAGMMSLLFAAIFGATQPLGGGLDPRIGLAAMTTICGPFVWLLVFRNMPESSLPQMTARSTLAFASALWPLAAYPTPGTQLSISTLPIAIAVLIAFADLVRISPSSEAWLDARSAFRLQRLVAAILLVALVIRGASFHRWRDQQAALKMPGASLLRMPPERVAEQKWITDTLAKHCDTFVFAQHGMNRFYYWSALPPPTSVNPTFWPHLLTAEQQQEIIRALRNVPRVGVVDLDYNAPLPDGPLRRYIDKNFMLLEQRGGVRILVNAESQPRAARPSGASS